MAEGRQLTCFLCDATIEKLARWKVEVRRAIIKFHHLNHNHANWVTCNEEPCKSIVKTFEPKSILEHDEFPPPSL